MKFHEEISNRLTLYIFQRNDPLKNLTRNRRGNNAPVIRALRFIHDYERQILWRITRKKSHERRNVFTRRNMPVNEFLSCSCFTFILCITPKIISKINTFSF